jgi:hypothetical protein
MRDPIEKVKQALRSAGAVYGGGGSTKGSTWTFPDGEEFLFERKAGNPTIDARVATRKLNVVIARRRGDGPAPAVNGAHHRVEPPPVGSPVPVDAAPQNEGLEKLNVPPSLDMKQRWETAVAQAEAYQEKLLADAQLAEKRVHMLKAMVPYLDDPLFADTLRAVLPSAKAPAPVATAPPPPPPPQHIAQYVQVTRDLVYAATQTFDDTFTVNDVMDRMLNGRNPDRVERLRIRTSIAAGMMALAERGQLNREQQGIGRQQTIWSKVAHHPAVTEPVMAAGAGGAQPSV